MDFGKNENGIWIGRKRSLPICVPGRLAPAFYLFYVLVSVSMLYFSFSLLLFRVGALSVAIKNETLKDSSVGRTYPVERCCLMSQNELKTPLSFFLSFWCWHEPYCFCVATVFTKKRCVLIPHSNTASFDVCDSTITNWTSSFRSIFHSHVY